MNIKRLADGILHILPFKRFYRAYPDILNYSITERCNCNCLMCGIRGGGQERPSRDEYRALYERKLFKAVKYAGITGGEPFLLDDLSDHVEEMLRSFTRLKSITFITNGLAAERIFPAMDRILGSAEAAGVRINLRVSFDGLGCHDLVRGVPGAESEILRTIAELDRRYRERLALGVDFTISRTNVGAMERTYFHFRDLGIPIKYRLAVPMARLHNEEKMKTAGLGRAEALMVCEFLDKLIYDSGLPLREKVFYLSLRDELLTGKRKRGCMYGYNAVGMDSRGRIFYCAPRSKVLDPDAPAGSDPGRAYFSRRNLRYRKELTRESCASCHHDYPGPVNLYMLGRLAELKLRRPVNAARFLGSLLLSHGPRFSAGGKRRPESDIAVHGWYGTETIGDKAILGGIIDLLKRLHPGRTIRVFSSMPHFTMNTLRQLACPDMEVVPCSIRHRRASLERGDLQVFGGGPLMDLPNILPIEYSFTRSAEPGAVMGCGIGPLFSPLYRRSVRRILESSDRILLRDAESRRKAVEITGKEDGVFAAADPAFYRYRGYRPPSVEEAGRRGIGFALRTVQRSYFQDRRGFTETERRFDEEMGRFIRSVASGNEVSFLPMCTYFRGFDDREYHLRLAGRDEGLRRSVVLDSLSPDEMIGRFAGMEFMVAMRYHSVLFSIIAETPFLAVMYDLGRGKIGSVLRELGLEDLGISVTDFSADAAERKLRALGKERTAVESRLREFKKEKNALFEEFLRAA